MGDLVNIAEKWGSLLFDFVGRKVEKMEETPSNYTPLEIEVHQAFWKHVCSVYFGRPESYKPPSEHIPILKALAREVKENFHERPMIFGRILSDEEHSHGKRPSAKSKAEADRLIEGDTEVLASKLWEKFATLIGCPQAQRPVVAFHSRGYDTLGVAHTWMHRVTITTRQSRESLIATLAHELCHLAVGNKHGHDQVFNKALAEVASQMWGITLNLSENDPLWSKDYEVTKLIEVQLALKIRAQVPLF